MTMNKYIGNRYVPLIYGDWDKSVSYESLTIVTYQGNSYTSRKDVPSNTEITNTEFWVKTGNYNAQLESAINDINNFKESVNNSISQIDTKIENGINEKMIIKTISIGNIVTGQTNTNAVCTSVNNLGGLNIITCPKTDALKNVIYVNWQEVGKYIIEISGNFTKGSESSALNIDGNTIISESGGGTYKKYFDITSLSSTPKATIKVNVSDLYSQSFIIEVKKIKE